MDMSELRPEDNGPQENMPPPDLAVEAGTEAPKNLKSKLKRTMMRVGILAAFLLVIFIGLTVILYPSISNYVNAKNATRVINIYDDALVALSPVDYTAYLEAARAYNAGLVGGAGTVSDAFDAAEDNTDRADEYWSLLDVAGNGMMGYIEIPQLDIRLPVYHGVSEAVLAEGVGHIQGSSLPVGGESTHAVVSAHTGLPRAKLFTGVDAMKIGDTFSLTVLNEILTYEVDQILTVLPHEVEALGIMRGGDNVTLVTCTPYGINSHRLLIRGTRIETPPQETSAGPAAVGTEIQEPGWFQRALDNVVAGFSYVVEGAATGLVRITEWGMDLFGVEY